MKMTKSTKQSKRISRHRRIRAKISGTKERPRFSVFRSNKCIYAQLIDDDSGDTLASVSDKGLKSAREAGSLLAKKAAEKKIKSVVFDRGGYKFHGKILELAAGAKEGGLEF